MDATRDSAPLLRLLGQRHAWVRTVADQVLREAIDVRVRQPHITLLSQLPDEGVPGAELARRLGVSAPTAHQWVRELVALGIVTVDPMPGSRREKLVTLTAEGHQMRVQALAAMRVLDAVIAERLGDATLATLREVLVEDWGTTTASAQEAIKRLSRS